MPRPKSPTVTVTCATCSAQRQVTVAYHAKSRTGIFFCDNDCRNNHTGSIPHPARRVKRLTFPCAACGKPKVVTDGYAAKNVSGLYFCSEECRRIVGSKPRRKELATCEICSTVFYPTATNNPGRFCGKECATRWQARNSVTYDCVVCGKSITRSPSQASRLKACSLACNSIAKMKRVIDGRWHNGKPARRTVGGYVMVYEPDHPDSHTRGGWILEHRLVASQTVGRRLRYDEQVHHVNGQKDCNDPSNLQIIDGSEHSQITIAEGSQRRRAAQRRIRELEANEVRMRAEQDRIAAELTELRKRLE